MKTTLTITVESEEKGDRYIMSHEGDTPDWAAANEIQKAVGFYWDSIRDAAKTKENLPMMKAKRKTMKARAKESAALVEKMRTVGVVNEKNEKPDFEDGIPF